MNTVLILKGLCAIVGLLCWEAFWRARKEGPSYRAGTWAVSGLVCLYFLYQLYTGG